ncbi:MAG TPA: alpha/beta hydrolase [Ktedonobacteraceae bacterium]|nr:alpha/beta hydrolase [Ktedonobacteraceae bacterium]
MLSRRTPRIKDAQGLLVPHSIASLEPVELGGIQQWILIRGKDRNLPVLLYLHGGPGGAQIGWAQPFQSGLEDHFIVVNWDQRGAGLSYSRKVPSDSLTIEQFTRDTLELVNKLRDRFATKKIYLVGHSWGSALGLFAVQQAPECFQAYIGVGQAARMDEQERLCWQWTRETAKEHGNQKAIKQLEHLGCPPYRDGLQSAARRSRWTDRFGGLWYHSTLPAATGRSLFTSREYSLLDVFRFFRGQGFSLKHTWDELKTLNLMERVPKVEVPVYFYIGRHDHAAPPELARQYFDKLAAPKKTWIWFENCAHFLPFEDPDHFLAMLVHIQQEIGSL